jgi:DNA-binding NtrC family response regulator
VISPKRILILDDEPNIGSSLRLILEREGFAVNIARTLAEAKAAADRADVGSPMAAESIFCASCASATIRPRPS